MGGEVKCGKRQAGGRGGARGWNWEDQPREGREELDRDERKDGEREGYLR